MLRLCKQVFAVAAIIILDSYYNLCCFIGLHDLFDTTTLMIEQPRGCVSPVYICSHCRKLFYYHLDESDEFAPASSVRSAPIKDLIKLEES